MAKTQLCKTIIRAYKGGHRDVARVFHEMLGHLFHIQIKDGKTLIFHRARIDEQWKPTHSISIKRELSTNVAWKFNEVAELLFMRAFKDHELIKPTYIDIAYALVRVGNLLKNGTYKAHVVREIMEMLVTTM